MLSILIAAALAAQAAPNGPAAAGPPVPKPGLDQVNEAKLKPIADLLHAGRPQQALDAASEVIASYDGEIAAEKRRIYCGMTLQETMLYMSMAAHDKTSAVAFSATYCTALFFKGFALVDLGRVAEAKAMYDRPIDLAPMHAQYLIERGQLSRLEKDWPAMLSLCERASSAAAFAAPDIKPVEQGRALRCQGCALVEEHQLDEAEARYHGALKIDPNDAKAQGELRYIAQRRATP